MMADTVDDLPVAKPVQPDMTPLDPSNLLRITVHPDPNRAKDPLNATVSRPQEGTVDALPVAQKAMPAPMSGKDADAAATTGRFSNVLNAFGQGYVDQWGAPNFAKTLSADLKKYDLGGDVDPGKAFNEAIVRPALNALDVSLRGLSGTFQAIHNASVEAAGTNPRSAQTVLGAPAAAIEAFPLLGVELGRVGWSPGRLAKPRVTGGVGDVPDLRVAKDLNVIGPPKPDLEGPPGPAAAKAIQPITAYHGSPYSFDAFSMQNIGTGEGAQVYGHGLYFAENPEVAADYAKNVRGEKSLGELRASHAIENNNGDRALKELQDDAARFSPSATLNEIKEGISFLENKDWEPPKGNHFQVKIHADKEAMLDWDKPFSEQSLSVQAAIKKLVDHFPNGQRTLDRDPSGERIHGMLGGDTVTGHSKGAVREQAASLLHDAGIPGIKYLDQGSRGRPVSMLEPQIAKYKERLATDKDLNENERYEIQSALNDLEAEKAKVEKDTHNFVLFSDKDIEITHRNGEPVSSNVPAQVNANNLTKPGEYPWFEKAQEYIGKLEAPDDVVSLLQSALAKTDYTQARAGNVPLAHWDTLSEASGVPTKEMVKSSGPANNLMRHDDAVRASTAMMLKAADDVVEAATSLRLTTGDRTAARTALGEAMMRRKMIVDTALEQIMGLRAEFGRTGNALQEFLKAKAATEDVNGLLKDKVGLGPAELDKLAETLDKARTRGQQTQLMRNALKPDFMDRLQEYLVNAWLSGPFTHAKYVVANTAAVAFDALVATPIAGVSGAVRQSLSADKLNRVYMGEAAAKVYGLLAGVPDALFAAREAVRTGLPTPLPPQLKGAGNANPVTGLRPAAIPGVTGTVIRSPSNVIAGIHTFYNFLGYRGAIESWGYRRAVKDGYKPATLEFWKAQRDHASFPDDAAFDEGITAGQRANFVQDLGVFGRNVQSMLNKDPTKLGKLIVPFMKVPGNIENMIQEGTPLAFADKRMRDDLLGKDTRTPKEIAKAKEDGTYAPIDRGVAKDMAIGRLVGGSAIMAWGAHMTLGDRITGHGPTDPKERAEWLRTHQPNSIQFGGQWHSLERFGPVGMWLSAAADITNIAQDIEAWRTMPGVTENDKKRADAQLQETYTRAVVGVHNQLNEAGFQGLFDLMDNINDPNKTKMSAVGGVLGSTLPFSSAHSQLASFFDPNLRELNTLLDGLKNKTVMRESIPAAVDWLGDRRPNPAYHSIIKNVPVGFDPIDLEMQHLDLKPSVPENNIRGARMTPAQYDEFKVYAGVNTRHQIEQWMNKPNWPGMPDYMKKAILVGTDQHHGGVIGAARKQAEAAMIGKYPELLGVGVQEKVDSIMGTRTKPNTYQRP